jgi:cytochrome c oxidase assembly protein subunit 15
MVHRLMALAILAGVAVCCWKASQPKFRNLCALWLGLVLAQAGLGMWTIWSNKAADIATLHVVFGASTLVLGSLIATMAFGFNFRCCTDGQDLA